MAMLAHELRNPLGAISSAVGVLEMVGGDPADRARGIIKRQMQHLTQLVDDLLDTARITTGKIALTRTAVNLAESAARCLKTLEVAGRTDGHVIEVDVEDAWVSADTARIDQIMANLIGNAVKYTPVGGRITIRIHPQGDHAVLEIADTGVGMPPEALERVFDLFFQEDRSQDRLRGGLGIGLTLVRQLVLLHGGQVEAASDGPGRGSRFTVRMPLSTPGGSRERRSPPPPGPRRAGATSSSSRTTRTPARCCRCCSSWPATRSMPPPMVRRGVEMARRKRPDIAVIDLGLPGMDGYEVARRLRREPRPDLRLIALTGYGQAEDRRKTLEAGFDMHLVKPVDPARLSVAIASLEARRDEKKDLDRPGR